MKKSQMEVQVALRVPDDEQLPSQEQVQALAQHTLDNEPGASRVQFKIAIEGQGSRLAVAEKPGLS